jgi:hypothetical protein|tara:strand:- start:20738 stop:20968 length:231 start_codon:yes stop_codon:yes gene_type:complete
MSFNTRPSTIAEINSWVNKRKTDALYQLKQTPKDDPLYDYLLERIAYFDKFVEARTSLIGKKLPRSKRDDWKYKKG